MPYLITCSHCKSKMRSPEKLQINQEVECPKCSKNFQIDDANQKRAPAPNKATEKKAKKRKPIFYVATIGTPVLLFVVGLIVIFGSTGKNKEQKHDAKAPRAEVPSRNAITPTNTGRQGERAPPELAGPKGPGFVLPGVASDKPLPPFDAKNPGALDNLDRSKIRADDLLPWYPAELVALVGSPRGQASATSRLQPALLGFTPDSKNLITWDSSGLRLWDARTLRNLSYLSFADLGGEPRAANLAADGRLAVLVPEAGAFEVAYQEGALKLGPKLLAAPGRDLEVITWGLYPDNSGAWRFRFRPAQQLELFDLPGPKPKSGDAIPAAKPALTIPIPTSGNLPRIFPGPKRKRIAIYSEIGGKQPHRLEVWSYDGPAPERKSRVALKHEAASLAFAEAEDTLAIAAQFGEWSLVKLQGDKGDVATGGKRLTGFISNLRFRRGDQELVALTEDSLEIYEVAGKPALKTRIDLKRLAGVQTNPGGSFAFSVDDRWLASVGEFGELRVWDAKELPPKMVSPAPQMPLEILAIPNAGARVLTWEYSFFSRETFRDWDLTGPAPRAAPMAEPGNFKAMSADGAVTYSIGLTGDIVLNRRGGQGASRKLKFPREQYRGEGGFSTQGRWLFAIDHPDTAIWDLQAEQSEPLVLSGRSDSITPPVFSRDDRFMLLERYPMMLRHDLATFPKPVATELFNREQLQVTNWALSSKGGRVLIERGPECLIVPADKKLDDLQRSGAGKVVNPGVVTLNLDAAVLTSAAAFSPDDRYLARADRGSRLAIFDTATGAAIQRFAPWGIITHLHFADDGRHLLVGNADHTIFVLRLGLPK
jgi:WD40 repeat protein